MPENWQPYLPIVTGLVRHLITILGGVGVTWAQTVSGSQIETAVSAGMMAAGLIWSAWQKIDSMRKGQRAAESSAAQSAAATMENAAPTSVVVQAKVSA